MLSCLEKFIALTNNPFRYYQGKPPNREINKKIIEKTDVCEERRLKRTEREKQREEQRKRREERRKERELNKAKKIQKQPSTGKHDRIRQMESITSTWFSNQVFNQIFKNLH